MTQSIPVHQEPGFNTEYRGWTIWKWTGWKCNFSKAERAFECYICGKQVEVGANVDNDWRMERVHWECRYPDIDPLLVHEFAQWCASKNNRHVYAAYPGHEGLTERGASFDVDLKDGQTQITRSSLASEKDAAKRECFDRLCRVIDAMEAA